ncbi:MAG TPA: hypothetical protein PLZ36_06035 [Armatimonadota bacterium]|nr:hypothetical protein [Armatimonadota bacterium]HOS42654.1 hypothetical protein [Armatimonadota bacterium]
MATAASPLLARLERAISLPVLMKEMRSRMRGIRAPILLFIVTGLTIAIGLLILVSGWGDVSYGDVTDVGMHMAELGHGLFVGLMIVEGILCALIAPALTAGAISIEREQQTLELLLLTRLTSANLVLGKMLSSLSFVVIILLCGLPVGAISFFLGGVDPAQFCWSLAVIVAAVAMFGAIGIYCSARFAKTTTAVVLAYAGCLAWLGLLPVGARLMEGFHSADGEIILQLLLTVGTLLTLAAAPATVISVLLTLVLRHRMPRLVNLALWGVSAVAVCLLLYLPGAAMLFDLELLLLGNPIVALAVLFENNLGDFPIAGLTRAQTELLAALFAPLTVCLQLLAAWVVTVLAIGEVQRMRR